MRIDPGSLRSFGKYVGLLPGRKLTQLATLISHAIARPGVIGLKVDEVRRIVNVTTDQLLPPPPLVRGIRGELLIAVIAAGDEIFLLIDLENVLSAGEKDELRAADLTQTA